MYYLSRLSQKSQSAFTLIELLIVVAVIAVLAGLAAENYFAAALRARTARVKSEFRTLAGAIEAYRTDHNQTPRMAHKRFYDDAGFDYYQGVPVSGVLSRVLTTPVAYITEIYRKDPFMIGVQGAPVDEQLYTYQDIDVYVERNPDSDFWPAAREYYGPWRLASVGPNQVFFEGFANSAQLPYDPTNGLLSDGNIWYFPGSNFNDLPPIPQLLDEH